MLESFATKARDKAAALRFMKKLMKRHGCAKAITTDGLRSYRAAMKEVGIADRQEVGRWANNRAENSHQPLRRRERAMLRFRRMKTLQQFASVHAALHNHFNQERHVVGRDQFRKRRSAAGPSGGRSPPELGRVGLPCARVETSRGWTDSTATRSRDDQTDEGHLPSYAIDSDRHDEPDRR